MSKADFRKTLKHLYVPSTKDFEVVDVPEMNYLMIDGHGNPNTALEYKHALETIYPVAYKLKFASKALNRDYVVPPLEGLWWAEDMASFTQGRKDDWDWTLMIMTPDWITRNQYCEAIDIVRSAKKLPAIEKLRFESLAEGKCVQIMHVGPYDDEASTLARLHDHWLPVHSFKETGKHHEIYISDPRKTAPEKLKTVLRQPVIKVQAPAAERG